MNTSAPKLDPYKQATIEIVLRHGTLCSMPDLLIAGASIPASDKVSKVEVTCTNMWNLGDLSLNSRPKVFAKTQAYWQAEQTIPNRSRPPPDLGQSIGLQTRDLATGNSIDEFQGIGDDLQECFCIPSKVQINIPIF